MFIMLIYVFMMTPRKQVKPKLFYLFGTDNPNVIKTIIGWWWGKPTSKNQMGYADRPLGQEVIL